MNRILNTCALFISGLSIGWMMGMSVSPVVQTTLNTLLTLLVGILSLVAGTQSLAAADADKAHQQRWMYLRRANLLPVGAFLLALSVGSATGIFTRTNDLLGPNPSVMAWRWGARGADSLTIAKSLLNRTCDTSETIASDTGGLSKINPQAAVLYSRIKATPDFCKQAEYKNGGELKTYIERFIAEKQAVSISQKRSLDSLQHLLNSKIPDNVLQQIRNDLCATNSTGS